MNKESRVIGCHSGEERHHLIFRSMIRVLCQNTGSSLRHHWSFSDTGPFDVRVIDIDDAGGVDLSAAGHSGVVVLLGHPQRLPADHALTLSKPLRGNEFLQLLQAIEARDGMPVAEAPALPAENSPHTAPVAALHGVASHQEAVISLREWPDLPRLPEAGLQDAARICALLSHRPSSRTTISHFLDLPPERVERALALIRAGGRQDTLQETMGPSAPVRDLRAEERPSSFLSKIWNRLRGAA